MNIQSAQMSNFRAIEFVHENIYPMNKNADIPRYMNKNLFSHPAHPFLKTESRNRVRLIGEFVYFSCQVLHRIFVKKHNHAPWKLCLTNYSVSTIMCRVEILGSRQAVRQWTLTPSSGGSNPSCLASSVL